MQEQLVSFETSKLAKSKGCYITNYIEDNGAFRENVVQFYNDSGRLCTERDYNTNCCVPDDDECSEIPAPTQSLLQRWLREVHKINSRVASNSLSCHFPMNGILSDDGELMQGPSPMKIFKTYEEALEYGLYQALLLINK